MTRPNWNHLVPQSLSAALQLNKDFAISTKQMSVPRIADRIGCSTDSLYKYLGGATMPANLLIPFMEACHRVYPLQYMAHSLNLLLIPMPRGRKAEHKTLVQLNMFCSQVMALMLSLQSGEANSKDVVNHLTLLLESIAYHRAEVQKQVQPELDLFGGNHHV